MACDVEAFLPDDGATRYIVVICVFELRTCDLV